MGCNLLRVPLTTPHGNSLLHDRSRLLWLIGLNSRTWLTPSCQRGCRKIGNHLSSSFSLGSSWKTECGRPIIFKEVGAKLWRLSCKREPRIHGSPRAELPIGQDSDSSYLNFLNKHFRCTCFFCQQLEWPYIKNKLCMRKLCLFSWTMEKTTMHKKHGLGLISCETNFSLRNS